MINTWDELIGHDKIIHWLRTAIEHHRLAGSFLFVGPAGVGKHTVAVLLAKTLLCEQVDATEMSPCGVCEACVQVTSCTHPDFIIVRKPEDKSTIPLDLLIGRPEVRMQEGFCRDVRLRPYRGRRKIALIQDADYLNEEGANCLLKTLEEPPANAVMILIGTSEQKQLPTIRSRCRTLRFASLQGADAVRLLRTHYEIEADEAQISAAVELAAGDMHVAAHLLSGDGDAFHQTLRSRLAEPYPDPIVLSRIISEHIDAAGKDANKRRDAMRDVFSMAVQHYRGQMRDAAAAHDISSATLSRLDRSIRALREVDRSANQTTLIECYAADIATATTGDRGEIG